MIKIKIHGENYFIPDSLKSVKLTRWIEYMEFIDKAMPKVLREIIKLPTAEEQDKAFKALEGDEYMQFLEYCHKEIAFWTGCEYSILRKHDKAEIVGFWWYLQDCLDLPTEDKTFSSFICDDEIFHLPAKFMTDKTLEDYAEANTYEKHFEELVNGYYNALFYIAAIICRRKEDDVLESFDDYDQEFRAARFKDHLTTEDAFQIGFFLQRRSNMLLKDFQIFMTSSKISKLRQATKS